MIDSKRDDRAKLRLRHQSQATADTSPKVFLCRKYVMCAACKHVCFQELCKVYGGCCRCVRNYEDV